MKQRIYLGGLLAALLLGLGLGLAWQPYRFQSQQLGPATAILKINRLTGRTWVLMPGTTDWQETTTGKPRPSFNPNDPLRLFPQ